MSITVGPYEFTNVEYDADNDILFASIGRPGPGFGEGTPEGHTFLTEDDDERVIGLDLFYPRRILEEEGSIHVTLPSGERVEAQGVAAAIKQPA